MRRLKAMFSLIWTALVFIFLGMIYTFGELTSSLGSSRPKQVLDEGQSTTLPIRRPQVVKSAQPRIVDVTEKFTRACGGMLCFCFR